MRVSAIKFYRTAMLAISIVSLTLLAHAQTPLTGTLSGTVVDASGAAVGNAELRLDDRGPVTRAGGDGAFVISGAAPGDHTLRVSALSFLSKVVHVTVIAGKTTEQPAVVLQAGDVSEVNAISEDQLATLEVHEEEHQRLGGVIPNFYVAYDFNAPPMSNALKWQLGWKNLVDPVNIAIVAGFAGLSQADNALPGYGQGAAGYGKRFGAGMGDFAIGSLLSGVVLPIAFKEDPRYFYKGTGSVLSRTGYALATPVVCRKDTTRHWGPCWSNILGGFAGGAASNLYYPKGSRTGVDVMFKNGAISLGFDGVSNLIQEFVLKHVTPKGHNHGVGY
jgi:hypothetical protein